MNIILSGSGSGGHIYPCINTYKHLKNNHKIIVIIFKNIDKDIYNKNKIKYEFIDDNLSNIEKIRKIIKIFKNNNIDLTMTFGGKNSVFINLVSKMYKRKIYIFEQNSIMGKANKINYILCDKLFSNFILKKKKEVNIGNPNAFNIKCNNINLFNNNKITILITLGSLGSSSINKIVNKFINLNDKYNIIYVSGKNVKSNINNNTNLKIYNYYEPLTDLINYSDIIISRAGASTISEIIALNKVAILIPSPYVTNNHQYKNAKVLADKNACILLNEKELTASILINNVNKLTHNQKLYNQIKQNIKKEYKGNNFKIIDEVLKNENL